MTFSRINPRCLALRLAAVVLAILLSGCSRRSENVVIIYTSQDQIYAERIFQGFTAETGIDVRPVYDTESVKTAGLANRLRFEKSNPQCDLFWNNEEMHTRLLASEDIFREKEPWLAVGCRTRRIVINTNLLSLPSAPKSLLELTNSAWRGKVVLAYPLFGTTSYQFLALRQTWGDDTWKAWCRGLAANQAKIVDGNSVVVKLVARGEAQLGLTDSDDIASGVAEGLPIAALPINAETLAIPNTLGVVRGAPHPAHAERFKEYLSRESTLAKLASFGAIEGTDFAAIRSKTLKMDWNSPLANFVEASAFLKEVFLR